jgi:hypothetical protein
MFGGLQGVGLAFLDDPAAIHYENPVAETGDDGQVMADEDEAHAAIRDQIVEYAQDLVLNRYVESRGGLIGDQ